MDAQETILRNCQHEERYRSLVDMGHGERLLVCCECWNAGVAARRAVRKAQLAAMPRCEAQPCKLRQTVTLAGTAHLCGRHASKAQAEFLRQFSAYGILAMAVLATMRKEDILRLATKGEPKH